MTGITGTGLMNFSIRYYRRLTHRLLTSHIQNHSETFKHTHNEHSHTGNTKTLINTHILAFESLVSPSTLC